MNAAASPELAVAFPPAKTKRRWWKTALVALVVLGAFGAWFGWYKFFRELPQPDALRSDPELRFKYGSIGAERDAGIPYWIFYVLPRVFPDKLPGPGGYASLGVSWEQGHELPIGFTKKVVGFERVANNCAACHSAAYRKSPEENPTFVNAGPGHTLNLVAFFRFLVDCAKDPRFNPDNLMREINLSADLSWIDRAIYRFLLIPITKKRLLEREAQFAWIYRHDFPDWGRGRDDAMNLTKYFMIGAPMDDSFGPTDIPSIWNLKKYDAPGTTMNWSGDSHDAYSVVIDSALGVLGAAPKSNAEFLGEAKWLVEYLRAAPPPKYPFPVDAGLAAAGKPVFDAHCASCHASEKTGRRMPLAAVGTDAERMKTWTRENAIASNIVVSGFGIERKGLVEAPLDGYNPPFLDGVWLRAPYLHNGSVPTLRDLLTPPEQRPKLFWRGYDVYDPVNVGFFAPGPAVAGHEPTRMESEARRVGTKHDTSQRANSNQGHAFGTDLPAAEKDALLEYLKTL
jgi:mono/diheme cytochrome c family protein